MNNMDDIKEADGFDTIVFDRVQAEKIKESHMAQSYMPLTEYVTNDVKDKQKEKHYRGFGFGKKEKRVTSCEGDYGKDECEVANHFLTIDDLPKHTFGAELYGEPKHQPEEDIVNHPTHYANNGAMECFDEFVMLYGEEAAMHACLFNVHKYRYRANMKGGNVDQQKSDWYIAKYKELKEIVDKRKRDKHMMFKNDMKEFLSNGAILNIDDPEFIRLYKKFLVCD